MCVKVIHFLASDIDADMLRCLDTKMDTDRTRTRTQKYGYIEKNIEYWTRHVYTC